jgi:hypothetical protein
MLIPLGECDKNEDWKANKPDWELKVRIDRDRDIRGLLSVAPGPMIFILSVPAIRDRFKAAYAGVFLYLSPNRRYIYLYM